MQISRKDARKKMLAMDGGAVTPPDRRSAKGASTALPNFVSFLMMRVDQSPDGPEALHDLHRRPRVSGRLRLSFDANQFVL